MQAPDETARRRQERKERFLREVNQPPPQPPAKKLAHPGGKIVTSDKERALLKLIARKQAAGEALSFAIVLGATDAAMADAGVRAILSSRYLTGQLRVGVAEHVYVCGRQHMQANGATFRACDSACFLLQSVAASKRWPTTPKKLEKLRAAFRETNGGRADDATDAM